MGLTFPKQKKLKSRKAIKQLFDEGKAMSKYPIRLLYLTTTQEFTQAGFAVPKRNFKHAVTRIKLKRLLREAYRLHKKDTIETSGTTFALLFIYTGKELANYKKIEQSIVVLLKKLRDENS